MELLLSTATLSIKRDTYKISSPQAADIRKQVVQAANLKITFLRYWKSVANLNHEFFK